MSHHVQLEQYDHTRFIITIGSQKSCALTTKRPIDNDRFPGLKSL
jgi:hypothetical protein